MRKQPKDTDLFLVDIEHGHHYHNKGCVAANNTRGDYKELSYREIKALRTHDGQDFEPDICVKVAQNVPRYWGLYNSR
jgi:hypothetical protein